MNIVLVSSALIPRSTGGVEVLTILLAEGFARLGHSVCIITGGGGPPRIQNGVRIIEIPELDLPTHLKGFLMPVYAWRIQRKFRSLDEIQSADIVNAVDLDSIISLAGWKEIQDKYIATIQDYGLVCANGLLLDGNSVCPNHCHTKGSFGCLRKRKISLFHKAYLEIAYRIRKSYRDRKLSHIQRAICVSKFVENQIKKIHPTIKTHIIGNCLPREWWYLKDQKIERDIDILYAGRLESFKGAEVFCDTIPLLPRKRPLQIKFLGGGHVDLYRKRCDSLVVNHIIEFAQIISFEQMYRYYRRAKIVVVPSVWPEPCGRVIIEAMYWGCAVISTYQGGTPELIQNNVNGLLITPHDTRALSSAITKLLEDEKVRKTLGRSAQRTAHKKYYPDFICQTYISTYKECVGC